MTRLGIRGLVFALVISALAGTCQPQNQTGNSSIELPQFWNVSAKPVSVSAPNGILALKITSKRTGKSYPDDEWVPEYYIEMHGKQLEPSIKCFAMPHALWAPDSAWLAITSSDGGLVGNWKVFAYNIEARRVITHNVMAAVQADLAPRFPVGINPPGTNFFSDADRRHFAKDTSWVNVRAIRWDDGDQLVVTASVPPSSGYGVNSGKERAYIVSPTTGRSFAHTRSRSLTAQNEKVHDVCQNGQGPTPNE